VVFGVESTGTEDAVKTLGSRLFVLTAGMFILGLLLAAVAYGVAGLPGVEGLVYSLLLCLIPGLVTVIVSEYLKKSDLAAHVVLVGGGLRMVFVLAGMFAVSALRPDLGFRQFTVWLIICYLVALALETAVILVPASSGNSVNDRS
jgi:uncharacterized membrane protein YwaF